MPDQTYKQLSEQVTDTIRQMIHAGQLRSGQWLRQEHLAQAVGVSPTPLREAVKVLVAEGLLEHLPYRGVRVVQFSPADVEDIYSVRAHLESLAARAAAESITNEELRGLEEIHAEMLRHLGPEQIDIYRNLNMRFHHLIYTASRRQYLIRALNQLWAISPSMLWANFAATALRPTQVRNETDPAEHEGILQALMARDGDLSAERIRAHIEAAGRELLEAIGQQSQ